MSPHGLVHFILLVICFVPFLSFQIIYKIFSSLPTFSTEMYNIKSQPCTTNINLAPETNNKQLPMYFPPTRQRCILREPEAFSLHLIRMHNACIMHACIKLTLKDKRRNIVKILGIAILSLP